MGKALWLNSYLSWLGSLASHRKDVNLDLLPLGFDVKRTENWECERQGLGNEHGSVAHTSRGGWSGVHRWDPTLLFSWALPWSVSSLPPSSSVIDAQAVQVSALRYRVLWSWNGVLLCLFGKCFKSLPCEHFLKALLLWSCCCGLRDKWLKVHIYFVLLTVCHLLLWSSHLCQS